MSANMMGKAGKDVRHELLNEMTLVKLAVHVPDEFSRINIAGIKENDVFSSGMSVATCQLNSSGQ